MQCNGLSPGRRGQNASIALIYLANQTDKLCIEIVQYRDYLKPLTRFALGSFQSHVIYIVDCGQSLHKQNGKTAN